MYTKLFSSIVYSSIWSEDMETRVLWVTLLAIRDQKGFIFANVCGLSKLTSIPIKKIEQCIRKFLSPDPRSTDIQRAPQHQGRRLEVIDGGWRMLNAAHYDKLRDAEDRRLQMQENSRAYRQRKAKSIVINRHQSPSEKHHQTSSSVTQNHPSEVEVEVDSESDVKKEREEKRGTIRLLEDALTPMGEPRECKEAREIAKQFTHEGSRLGVFEFIGIMESDPVIPEKRIIDEARALWNLRQTLVMEGAKIDADRIFGYAVEQAVNRKKTSNSYVAATIRNAVMKVRDGIKVY